MTLWVGLSGGIGSGKSTVADCFRQFGVLVLNADDIAKTLTQIDGAALPAIRTTFGDAVFHPNGELNRQALRELIFRQPEQKQQLENILHPLIYHTLDNARQQILPFGYGIMEIPLLIEKPLFQQLVNRILIIDAFEQTQINRVKQRNALSDSDIHAIMTQQASRQARLAIADDVIANNGDLAHLQQAVTKQHQIYLALTGFTS
ncbi:dephospho-CoA kinase [Stenoxybacter acetivorans]|uniref:dephospho-CoA kinase n=1 Tax=Stenoxybacter acetivorans TaxID=422441 RepID=UPI0005613343|nr:dephospho-CoA kinase [Stenoxybacter acetivorans]